MIRLRPDERTEIEIAEFISRIDELIAPGQDAIRPIQQTIRAGFAFNFAAERGDDRPWAPLAPYTMRERRSLGFPPDHPILVRTGQYRSSFVDEGHPAHVSEWTAGAGRWTIEEGSTDERADHLEFGTWRIPARPVTLLGRSGEDMLITTLELLFDQWFEGDGPG